MNMNVYVMFEYVYAYVKVIVEIIREEEVTCKPMECEDEILCVLISIDIWEEGSCVSRWRAKMEYYVC